MNKYLLLAAALFAACAHSESRKNTLPEKPIETTVKSHKNILPTAQAAADMAAPHIRNLDIQPNFDAALFSVDAKTFLNDLQFTPAEKEQRYYFYGADQEHGSSEQAQGGGYYRLIFGSTAQGDSVAQDFYQDIEAPQTAPFLLVKGKEKDFSTDSSNGRTVWYTPEGTVESIADFAAGKRIGWSLILREGKPIMRIHTIDDKTQASEHVIFDAEGRIVIHSRNNSEYTFFYPNGSAMFYVDEGRQPLEPLAWDENGKSIDPFEVLNQINELILHQDKVIQYILDSNDIN